MRYNWTLPMSNHLTDLLLAYHPQSNPVWDYNTSRFYHTLSPFYPMFMLNYSMAERERLIDMAKGARKRKSAKMGDYSFIRYSLNAGEKEQAKKYAEKSADELDKLITEVLQSGHKISFSYNETNDNVTCTITGKPEESLNEYRMLTSFASSWWVALAVNLYKHFELFSGEVWQDADNDADFG